MNLAERVIPRSFASACATVCVFTFTLCGPARASAAGPIRLESDADREALVALERSVDVLRTRVRPDVFSKIDEVEMIDWVWCPQFERALQAFQLSADPRHLATFVHCIEVLETRLSRGPEGRRGFRGVPLALFRDPASTAQVEVNITEFNVARILCEFVEIVRADPALVARFGAAADRFLELAERDLAGDKWEQRGDYVDLGDGGAVFRMARETNAARSHLTDPHNKQSTMCRAYLALHRVTGHDEYFKKAIKLGIRFKHTLGFSQGRYTWHYWDPAGAWDYKPGEPKALRHWVGAEHRSGYHELTLEMVEALYDHGVVFSRTDIERFVATQTQVCWNGSRTAPKFFKTDGKPTADPSQPNFIAPVLARFDASIRDYFFGAMSARGGRHLQGRFLVPAAAEPQRTQFRANFIRDSANAAWLARLEFDITTP